MSRSLKMAAWVLAIAMVGSGAATAQAAAKPAGEEWTRGISEKFCKSFAGPSIRAQLEEAMQRRPLPDSVGTVELALEALGRNTSYADAHVLTYLRTDNGVLIGFELVGAAHPPETRDETASVYVHDGRCVTLLGR